MWTYKQSTGELLLDGLHFATGYSGWDDGDGVPEPGEGKNDPRAEAVPDVGPVPRGRWRILGPPFLHRTAGPFTLRLLSLEILDPAARKRNGFLIHGDSVKLPGSASHGCIILPRSVRLGVWDSGDRDLEVVA